VFVDFTKAFALVDRGLLLERCRALGISGACMRALEALYDRVLLRVAVGGRRGASLPVMWAPSRAVC
jgi:hypothetical protein